MPIDLLAHAEPKRVKDGVCWGPLSGGVRYVTDHSTAFYRGHSSTDTLLPSFNAGGFDEGRGFTATSPAVAFTE